LAQDAGEIPIGLYVFDKTPTCWLLPVPLVLGLLMTGGHVVFMLRDDLGNGGHDDGGGGWRGSIPDPPDPTSLGACTQFKQVIHARATSQPGHQAEGSPQGTWAGLIPPLFAPQATLFAAEVVHRNRRGWHGGVADPVLHRSAPASRFARALAAVGYAVVIIHDDRAAEMYMITTGWAPSVGPGSRASGSPAPGCGVPAGEHHDRPAILLMFPPWVLLFSMAVRVRRPTGASS